MNFDHDRGRAEELVNMSGCPGPRSTCRTIRRTRELWADGPGITALPRLFLIDRAGILRWAGTENSKRKFAHYSTSRVFDVSTAKLRAHQLTRGTASF